MNGTNSNIIEDVPVNPGSAQVYDFRGIPNNGNIELEIRKDELLLVGNPYPSALDLNKFLLENTNTTGIAYFWDSKKNGSSHYLSDYEGGYGTYSAGTGIYVPPAFVKYSDGAETGEFGGIYARSLIPIAQGFMVKAKNDGKVIFRNGHRAFQKEEKGASEFKSSETKLQAVRLNIEFDSTYVRQLVLAFTENATDVEDHALDARQLNMLPKDASWKIGETDYNINVRPKNEKELIPLKLKLDKNASVMFQVGDLQDFDPDRIFVYDAKQDLYFGIKSGDLKLELPAGDYNDRFFISFIEKLPAQISSLEKNPEALKPANVLLNSVDIFQNNLRERLEVKILYDSAIENISIFNLNGRLVFEQNFRETPKEFIFNTANLSNAVYIVKVKTTDNIELTKKIGVKN